MKRASGTPRTVVHWVGFAAGPVLAVVCYLLLPEQYRDTAGDRTRVVGYTAIAFYETVT